MFKFFLQSELTLYFRERNEQMTVKYYCIMKYTGQRHNISTSTAALESYWVSLGDVMCDMWDVSRQRVLYRSERRVLQMSDCPSSFSLVLRSG